VGVRSEKRRWEGCAQACALRGKKAAIGNDQKKKIAESVLAKESLRKKLRGAKGRANKTAAKKVAGGQGLASEKLAHPQRGESNTLTQKKLLMSASGRLRVWKRRIFSLKKRGAPEDTA